MQSAVKRKLSEAELRRRALRVYEGSQDDEERQAEIRRAERRRTAGVRRLKVQLVGSIFAIFLLSMGYMVLNTQVTVIGYEINQQMTANDDLQNENTRLVLEIEQATSPEKVAGFAAEHFNMVAATEDSVIYYDPAELGNTAPTLQTGMAVDAKSLGYGSLEVLEDTGGDGLLGKLSAFWDNLSSAGAITLGMRD